MRKLKGLGWFNLANRRMKKNKNAIYTNTSKIFRTYDSSEKIPCVLYHKESGPLHKVGLHGGSLSAKHYDISNRS